MECVERACDQIRTSDRLAHTLRAVLATGNTMNCGTHRGDASAIKLDSLAKMADVKVCCHFLTLLSIAVLHVLRQTGTPSCVGQCGVDMHILGMLSSFLFVCSMANEKLKVALSVGRMFERYGGTPLSFPLSFPYPK